MRTMFCKIINLLILTIGLFGLSAKADPALVAWWNFDDESDPAMTLDKIAGNPGSVEGATFTPDAGGRTGSAGDKGMDIAAVGLVRVSEVTFMNDAAAIDEMTIVFWQKLHVVQNSSAFWGVSPSSNNGQRGIQAHTPWSNNRVYFDTVGCCTGGAQRLDQASSISLEEWHHFAFVKSVTHKEIWIDGAKLAENDGASPFVADFTMLIIGADGGGGGKLNGVLDDFAVFSGTLNEEQIAKLAAGTAPDLILSDAHPRVEGFTPRGPEQPTDVSIDFTLVNGSVDSVKKWELLLDGNPTPVKTGTTAGAATYPAPAGGWALGSKHTAVLNYTDTSDLVQTAERKFTIKPFGPGTLFIEAEDFNYSEDGVAGGLHADFTSPDCSLLTFNAAFDIDYHETNNGNDQALYRGPTGVEAGKEGVDGYQRGDNTITCSYIVGWNDAGDWYNYTREFPGNDAYKIYARLSSGGAAEHAKLSIVTSPADQPEQTLSDIGEFKSPATGGWDTFHTIPLKDANGDDVVIRLKGLKTLRFTVLPGNLDINYLAFVPTAVDTILPVVATTTPAGGSTSARDPLISVTIADRDTQVKGSSIKLFLNDLATPLTPVTLIEDHAAGGLGGATVSFQTTTRLPAGSTANARVTFSDDAIPPHSQTVNWTFVVGPFTGDTKFIEAEDFNYSNEDLSSPGQHANFGDPDCSLLGKEATEDIDYHEGNNGNAQAVYRGPTGVEAGKLGTDSYVRGNNTVTCSYIVGWNDAGDWYNYTRDFGASKRYNAYARLSSGGAAENAELALITTDPTAPDQEKTALGQFNSPATGNWDLFHTIPLRDGQGNLASFRLSGEQTLRFTTLPGNLDVNWLALVPADIQIVGPSVTTLTPPNGTMADFGDPTLVSAVVQDGDTAVVPGSLKLTLDGVDVTATSTITDTATGAMIEYQLAGAVKGSVHTTRVDFKDTTGAAGSGSWGWTSSPYSLDNLFIEAEDFNTDGGNYFPSKGGVPFNEKSLYNTLGAVTDVDFHDNGNSEADNYRNGEVPNLGIADISSDQNVRGAGPRPGFTTTPDYKIGWNDAGEWRNYTRTFPPGNYYVYARLSSGGSDEHAHLDMVADATIVGPQALTRLGRFDAPATGGWDTMAFVPLKDNGGNLASVSLAGEKTLRFTVDPGNLDFNYLMLCPVPAAAPRFTSIVYLPPRAGFPLGGVTLTWEGGCELQVSDNVNGPWVTVGGATSPLTAGIDRAKRFARIRCP